MLGCWSVAVSFTSRVNRSAPIAPASCGLQHLDRHRPLVALVGGEPHGGHAAAAELSLDDVASDSAWFRRDCRGVRGRGCGGAGVRGWGAGVRGCGGARPSALYIRAIHQLQLLGRELGRPAQDAVVGAALDEKDPLADVRDDGGGVRRHAAGERARRIRSPPARAREGGPDAHGVVELEAHGSPGEGSVLREHPLQDVRHRPPVRAVHMPNRTRRVSCLLARAAA